MKIEARSSNIRGYKICPFRIHWIIVCSLILTLAVADRSVLAGSKIEIPTLQWGDSKRPDGTTRHWNPKPLIELGATLVCVAYRPLKEDGKRWHSVGMTPPKLLAKALENTKPELDECHQHGIKVIGYADTIMFHRDMFEDEGVDTEKLYAYNHKGNRVVNTAWDKGGVGVSCISNPKWVELQKEVTMVTARAGFDGLQFDVYPYAIEPGYQCTCSHCHEGWRKQSKRLFRSPQSMPGLDSGKLDFRNPVDRAFKVWRLQEFVDFVKEIEAHANKSHPNFMIIMNHGGGTPDFTYEAVAGGLKYPSTELWHLKLGDDSSLYLYSSAEAANGLEMIGLLNYADQRKPDYRYRVAMAEAFAAGGTFYVNPGRADDGGSGEISHQYCNFLRERKDWFLGTRSDADVAVLYSWKDQAFLQGTPVAAAKVEFDPKRNYYQRAAAVLARMGIAHDCIIVEKGLKQKELSRYKVIVAPDLSLVSEQNASALKKFIRSGGQLLAIGDLGTVTESGQEFKNRKASLLKEWTDGEAKAGQGIRFGKGRIAHAERATTDELIGTPPPSVNPDDALAQIKAPGPLAIPLKALSPDFLTACESVGLSNQLRIKSASPMECTVRAKGNRRALHLIRFGPAGQLQDPSAALDYEVPEGHEVREVSAWSPDAPGSRMEIVWKQLGERLQVQLKSLESYTLIGVVLEPKK